jgi:glucokinase
MGLTIGVDLGGTKIAAGVVDEEGTILEQVRRDTPTADLGATALAIIEMILDLRRRHRVEGVGVGVAGYIDRDRITVRFSPNLEPRSQWRNVPFASRLAEATGLPVVVENDANCAAWGEFRFGAGKDAEDLLLVTVGTGVGGGLVTSGRLYRGTFGIGAEIGHLRVVPAGMECGCGQYGCLEQYASGRAIVREARDRLLLDAPEAASLSALVGGDPLKLSGPMITAQARAGDPLCRDIIAEVGRWLGEGVASLVAVLDPGLVAIGGGVAEAGDLLVKPAQRSYEHHVTGARFRPHAEIRIATLGGAAGMIGAGDLARTP